MGTERLRGAGEGVRAGAAGDGPTAEMGRLLLELTYTFFRSRAASDRIAEALGQSSGRFGLLRTLVRDGPTTVADIARSRPVARQGVQRLADGLAAEGLVVYVPNPRHRRSDLVRITPKGERVCREMAHRLERHAATLAEGFSARELRTASKVLRALRQRLAETPRDDD